MCKINTHTQHKWCEKSGRNSNGRMVMSNYVCISQVAQPYTCMYVYVRIGNRFQYYVLIELKFDLKNICKSLRKTILKEIEYGMPSWEGPFCCYRGIDKLLNFDQLFVY